MLRLLPLRLQSVHILLGDGNDAPSHRLKLLAGCHFRFFGFVHMMHLRSASVYQTIRLRRRRVGFILIGGRAFWRIAPPPAPNLGRCQRGFNTFGFHQTPMAVIDAVARSDASFCVEGKAFTYSSRIIRQQEKEVAQPCH